MGLWVVAAVNLVGICMRWGAVGKVLGKWGSVDDGAMGSGGSVCEWWWVRGWGLSV